MPFVIGRHTHPKARPEHPGVEPAPPTGIDYLHLLDTSHGETLKPKINFRELAGDPAETAGPAEAASDDDTPRRHGSDSDDGSDDDGDDDGDDGRSPDD